MEVATKRRSVNLVKEVDKKQKLEGAEAEKKVDEKQKVESTKAEKEILEKQKVEGTEAEKEVDEKQKLESTEAEKEVHEKRKVESTEAEKAVAEKRKVESIDEESDGESDSTDLNDGGSYSTSEDGESMSIYPMDDIGGDTDTSYEEESTPQGVIFVPKVRKERDERNKKESEAMSSRADERSGKEE